MPTEPGPWPISFPRFSILLVHMTDELFRMGARLAHFYFPAQKPSVKSFLCRADKRFPQSTPASSPLRLVSSPPPALYSKGNPCLIQRRVAHAFLSNSENDCDFFLLPFSASLRSKTLLVTVSYLPKASLGKAILLKQ